MFKINQSINEELRKALNQAFTKEDLAAIERGKPLDLQLVPASKPEFGDFQVNGALA